MFAWKRGVGLPRIVVIPVQHLAEATVSRRCAWFVVRTRGRAHLVVSGAPTMSARRQSGRQRGTPAGRRPTLARRRKVGGSRRSVREDRLENRSPCAEHVRRREPAGEGTQSVGRSAVGPMKSRPRRSPEAQSPPHTTRRRLRRAKLVFERRDPRRPSAFSRMRGPTAGPAPDRATPPALSPAGPTATPRHPITSGSQYQRC